MRMRSLCAAVAGLLISTGAAAQHGHGDHDRAAGHSAAEVTGDWTLNFDSQHGSVELGLELTQDEQRVRGFAMWGTNRIMIDRGTLEGDRISFLIVAGDGVTHQVEMWFEGIVDGDAMAGELNGFGDETQEWTAERAGH